MSVIQDLTLRNLVPNHDAKCSGFRSQGSLHGSHDHLLLSPSKMLDSSRVYRPGDPVKLIDWRVFARTSRLIVHEQPSDLSLRVGIVISTENSMNWPLQKTSNNVPKKIEIAQRILFHVAHMHFNLYDRVDIWLLHSGKYLKLKIENSKECLLWFLKQKSQQF